jgi:hypothetical protein
LVCNSFFLFFGCSLILLSHYLLNVGFNKDNVGVKIYLSHCMSDTTLYSGFRCSYHCKTSVCSNCHVLSYPYTSVSFSQISNFQNIFTILDSVALLFTIFRFLLMFNRIVSPGTFQDIPLAGWWNPCGWS